jgi:hypothetical protein
MPIGVLVLSECKFGGEDVSTSVTCKVVAVVVVGVVGTSCALVLTVIYLFLIIFFRAIPAAAPPIC